jgi:hypothetical protein
MSLARLEVLAVQDLGQDAPAMPHLRTARGPQQQEQESVRHVHGCVAGTRRITGSRRSVFSW